MRRKFRRTTLISCFCAAILVGLAAARTDIGVPGLAIVFSLLFLGFVARKKSTATLLAAILLGLSLGWWRGSATMEQLHAYDDYYGQEVTVTGTATDEGVYTDKSQLGFDIDHVTMAEPEEIELVGAVGISGFGIPAVYRGDTVQVTGKLYASRSSRVARISFAELAIVNRSKSPIGALRRKFVAGVETALPEPQASFGLGLLIGQRSTLSDLVTAQLAAVGLTHIVAVSGYNLTIISDSVRRLLKKRSKFQMVTISFSLIGLFILFAGNSPSIARAALVSTLGMAAWYYGRTMKPVLLILLAAASTAFWNPLYLWGNIGWYLSFLAFFGVLVVGPLIIKRLYGPDRQPKLLTAVIIETLCAQIMTVPLILYIFGEFSMVALLANVLVVPLVPLGMLLSLVAGLAGMIVPAISGWIAWPAKVLLTYMLDITSMMSHVPHALVHRSFSLLLLVVAYAMVAGLTFILWQRTKSRPETEAMVE